MPAALSLVETALPAGVPAVQASSVSFAYPDRREAGRRHPVLQELSLELPAGQTGAVIGPSGCGKTTLLHLLAGLMAPSAGVARLFGVEAAQAGSLRALVTQSGGLLPWKTVLDNVSLGLQLRGESRRAARECASSILAELGLSEHLYCFPHQLSGGQRQMAAIARALLVEPRVFLLDEPFSSLDSLTREDLQDRLLSIWRSKALSMLLVSHNVEEVVYLGRYIFVLSPRPAKLVAVLTNPEAGDPAYRGKRSFYRQCREVRAAVDSARGHR